MRPFVFWVIVKMQRHAIAWSVALFLILFGGWIAYRPGLAGDFLFDDFANLPSLGATGPINNNAALLRYLTSSESDPTGRPLALASFLVDAQDWPAEPEPFKRTSVLLHLLNGTLLVWVLLRLGRSLKLEEARASAAALAGAAAWVLHPLFVSTTLYVVQREAMLPATFSLIGILGWMTAREALARGQIAKGVVGLAMASGACTLLAVLCKANGALLPLLILLIEWIVLLPGTPMPSPDARRWHRRALWMLLALPTFLLATWLILQIPSSIESAAEIRDWTVPQRLLTEPRALVDYLGYLILPRAQSRGLFNDAFPVSTGLLQPWTTLPSLLLIATLVVAGIALRKRHPAIALALLFYFAAQSMESSWVPLELYFEHRNYLPALLLFWPIAIGLLKPGPLRSVRYAAVPVLLLGLSLTTYERAQLWGDSYHQSVLWAVQNPDSARAQATAAQYDLSHGRPRLAAARLRNAMADHPADIQIPINLIGAECELGAVRPETLDAASRALAATKLGGELNFRWFKTGLDLVAKHECTGLDLGTLQSLLDSARRNPHWKTDTGTLQDLQHLEGLIELAKAQPMQAEGSFNRALAIQPRPDTALEQAAILGSAGYPKLGLAHLDYWRSLPPERAPDLGMPILHAWVLRKQHYWEIETAHLRASLADAIAAKPAASPLPAPTSRN